MNYTEELLTVLIEECAEVQQAAAKIMRYGIDSEWQGETALESLTKELGDLDCLVRLATNALSIDTLEIDRASSAKYEKLKQWSNLIK